MVAIVLAFIIQALIAKPYEIPTDSMVPTIQPNDRVIANRVVYRLPLDRAGGHHRLLAAAGGDRDVRTRRRVSRSSNGSSGCPGTW